jgi:hypothetical protein
MVIVFAIGPKVRGFRPRRKRWNFKGDKNPWYDFLRREVKPSTACKILWHVKDPYRYDRDIDRQNSVLISRTVSLHFATRWQRQSIKRANRSFEDVVKFKYLATTLTDQNCIHEQIKSRLNSGNACYHSVQSLLSSRLLSKNLKVKIYKTIILPVFIWV